MPFMMNWQYDKIEKEDCTPEELPHFEMLERMGKPDTHCHYAGNPGQPDEKLLYRDADGHIFRAKRPT